MKYLLILDADSTAGKIYLAGNNDGLVSDGTIKHPVLLCTEIKMDSPYYIFAKRQMKAPASHQSLCLPYGSVAIILQLEENEPIPTIGFVHQE
jgi:hypothetical protein